MFALAYPAEFLDAIIKKLHQKNAAQKIDDFIKSKDDYFYPTLKTKSEALNFDLLKFWCSH